MFDRITTFFTDPAQLLIVPAALLAIMLHEVSHGFMAYRLGDLTAKQSGRLSLNPIRHIDILGLISMIFMGFGWAKPVPVDMRYFKKPRRDFALVALAGPMSNFIQAFLGFLLFFAACLLAPELNEIHPLDIFNILLSGQISNLFEEFPVFYLHLFLAYYILMNIGLGAFNLIPIPPLDGSKIVGVVIPDRYYYTILRYERFGMIALMILLFSGLLDGPLNTMRGFFLEGISWLASLPFQLLGAF